MFNNLDITKIEQAHQGEFTVEEILQYSNQSWCNNQINEHGVKATQLRKILKELADPTIVPIRKKQLTDRKAVYEARIVELNAIIDKFTRYRRAHPTTINYYPIIQDGPVRRAIGPYPSKNGALAALKAFTEVTTINRESE